MAYTKTALLVWIFAATSVQAFLVSAPADKVRLTVYIESLCPDCQRFFDAQLGPTFDLVPDILDLEIVPFGNAEETQNPDGSWTFTCQHGARECLGNLVETCALRLVPDMGQTFPFLRCLEASGKPDTHGPQCAQDQGLDYAPIQACVTSPQGNQWQHENAVKTAQLQPPHQYVPWVVLNGVHTEDIEKKAEQNLLKLVCQTYTGTPPAACACQQSWQENDTNDV